MYLSRVEKCYFASHWPNKVFKNIQNIHVIVRRTLYCETVSNFMTVIPAFSYERPSAASLSFDIILIIMTDLATA